MSWDIVKQIAISEAIPVYDRTRLCRQAILEQIALAHPQAAAEKLLELYSRHGVDLQQIMAGEADATKRAKILLGECDVRGAARWLSEEMGKLREALGEPGFAALGFGQQAVPLIVTVEDLDRLLSESTKRSIHARIERRAATPSIHPKHLDRREGHQPLAPLHSLGRQANPKRKPRHQQDHGESESGHDRSTQTQRETARRERHEKLGIPEGKALDFLLANWGKPITEGLLSGIANQEVLSKLVAKLMTRRGVNRDWLNTLFLALGAKCPTT